MAKSPRTALTRVAATVTARYYQSSGATDGFYLDGRISGRREHRAADITLDREDRGFFYSVFAHLAGGSPDDAAQGRVRKALDRILAEVRQPGHNIDTGINELAECAVAVAGRITLQHDGARQPYFAGIMVKDSELAAVTMGGGCAYLYRGDVLYPLTADDFPMEAINYDGKPVPGLDVYCAGVAGTVRYSNIAQLQLDDCVIVCNKEIMDALGQREVLRMLFEAEDQTDAAGLIMTAASAKLPGVPLQFMIGFVESISAIDRTGRLSFGRPQAESPAVASASRGSSGTAAAVSSASLASEGLSDEDYVENIDDSEFQNPAPTQKSVVGFKQGKERANRDTAYADGDDYEDDGGSGRGRRIAFYVIIAIICLGCLFAIFNLLFGDRGKTSSTTTIATTKTTTIVATTGQTSATTAGTATTSAAVTTTAAVPGQTQAIHTVVSGESLYSIANKYFGSGAQKYIDLIKTANNLTSDNLQVGQKLNIPAKP